MSNLDTQPEETLCDERAGGSTTPVTLLEPRDVPLGGLRATVRIPV